MLHARLKRREPLAAKAQHATRLGAFRDLEIYGAFEGGYFDFGAECSLNEGDGDFDVNVSAVSLKEKMLLQNHHDIEIARRAACDSGFALARHAKASTFFDTGRHLHPNRLLAFGASSSAATRARIGDDFARAAACVAGTVHPEEPLLKDQLAGSFTLPTSRRSRTLCRARPFTGFTASHLRDLEIWLATVQDIIETNLEVVTEIRAALTATATAAASPASAAEHVAE